MKSSTQDVAGDGWSAVFSGTSASGLAAYYEVDRGMNTRAGGEVTTWEDQSGNGNTLTSVGDPQVAAGPNAESVIGFDGAGNASLILSSVSWIQPMEGMSYR